MPAFNFKHRFEKQIVSGSKKQTIRNKRKDGRDCKVGDLCFLFVGMRTRLCRRIGVKRCISRATIFINVHGTIFVDGKMVEIFERHDFAKADGFTCWEEFMEFFKTTHGLPFHGFLFVWEP